MYAIDFTIGRAYSRSLLGANIAPNLVPWVLKKKTWETVENDIFLESESKHCFKNYFLQEKKQLIFQNIRLNMFQYVS